METIKKQEKTALFELLEKVQQVQINKGKQKQGRKIQLANSEKIKFACNYYSIMGNISILEVLKALDKQDDILKKEIISFIGRNNLLMPYPNTLNEYISPTSRTYLSEARTKRMNIKSISQEYNPQNWLEPYDENAVFLETKTKHPSYHIFIGSNGTPIKFDKNRATQVKLAIMDNEIIPARCIVEGAYQYVAKNEFSKYIKHIKTLKGDK